MKANLANLCEKLSKEKFGGKAIEWKTASLCTRYIDGLPIKIDVALVEDRTNIYFHCDGKAIFVSVKDNPDEMFCYECGIQTSFKEDEVPVTLLDSDGNPAKGTRIVYTPYCLRCDKILK